MFILEHYCTLKSFAAIHEVFSSASADKENNTLTCNTILGHGKCFVTGA
jgi:hypothetical protein